MAGDPSLFMTLSARFDDGVGGAFAAFERGAAQAGARGQASLNKTAAAAGNVDRQLRSVAAGLTVLQGPLGGVASRLNGAAQLFQFTSRGIATSVALLAGAGAAIGAASGIQSYQAKLVAATKSQEDFARAQAASLVTARDTRSDLGETIQFYVRLASATAGLGVSQKTLFNTISTISKSVQLSGANTQEATAAMQQFSQAIGSASGLGGDEFKSLGENASQVLDTIAKGLVKINAIPGFDGTRGALKKLGSEGKLTRDVLVPAIAAMGQEIDQRFSRMPVTIQQAVTQMRTSLTSLIISAEATTGGLGKIAGGIAFLADNFRLIGGAAVVAGTAIAARFVAPLVLAGLAATGTAVRFVALAVGMNGVVPAMLAQGVAAARLSTALTALLTPTNLVGVALTAAAAVTYYFATRASAAEDATDGFAKAQERLSTAVDLATGKIIQQNAAIRAADRAKQEKAVSESRDAANAARLNVAAAVRAVASPVASDPESGRITSLGENPKLAALGRQYEANRINVDQLRRGIIELARTDKSLTPLVARITELGSVSAKTAQTFVSDSLTLKAYSTALTDAERRMAQGDFSAAPAVRAAGAKAGKTKAQIDADIKALVEGGDTLRAATARYNASLADLKAKYGNLKPGGTVPEGYEAERLAIEQRYKSERDAVIATAADKAASAKADREAAAAARKDQREELSLLDKISRIRDRYDNEPSRKDQADKDKSVLVDGVARKVITSAEADSIRANIDRALVQPLRDVVSLAQQQADIQNLTLAGREADAEVLQRAYDLLRQGVDSSQIDLDLLGRLVTGERQRNREIERRNELIDIQARAYGDVQRSFRDLFADPTNLGGFVKNLKTAFRNSFADSLSLKIFGNAEKEARDRATGALSANTGSLDDLRTAVYNLETTLRGGGAGGSSVFGAAIEESVRSIQSNPLGRGANDNIPAGVIPGVAGAGIAIFAKIANDNVRTNKQIAAAINDGGVQTVTAQKRRGLFSQSDTATRFNEVGAEFGRKLDKVFKTGSTTGGKGKLESAGSLFGNALEGINAGEDAKALTKKLGIKAGGSSSGAGVGRDVGGAIGGAAGSLVGGPIGAAIGALASNVIGGLVGSLFGGVTDRAFRTVTTNAFGEVTPGSSRARGKNQTENLDTASQLADQLVSTINSITSALGATVQSTALLGEVGVYAGKFAFKAQPGDGGPLESFETAAGAVGAALRNAINNNIITGLRQGTKNLLTASADFETQLSKANKFESVFSDLKKLTDPVGSALDSLNTRFLDLANVFKEAGASADDYAKLQQLYDVERADALKTAGNATLESLKSYLSDLTTSSSSGLSLRDRQTAALDAFNPFAADIAAGKSVDVNAYRTAAENLREVERELYGSTDQYFSRLEQITGLTKQAIAGQTNVSSIADALNFTSQAASTTPITNGLASLQQTLAGQLSISNTLLQQIAANSGSGGDMNSVGYISGQGNF